MTSKTDVDLLAMMRDPLQREEGFRHLIDRYKHQLYMAIRRIVLTHEAADDVFQNTMVKIFRGLDQFEGRSSLFTWMYRIAVNESIAFVNYEKKRALTNGSDYIDQIGNALQSDVYFDGDKLQVVIQQAIAELPDRQRQVFMMRYYDEIKFSDMSEMLEKSEGALKASYFQAVKKIKEYLLQIDLS